MYQEFRPNAQNSVILGPSSESTIVCDRDGGLGRLTGGAAGGPLRIGLVNNMPDAAFEDTYRQFATLLGVDATGWPVELRCYIIPTVPRRREVLESASACYQEVSRLYADPPDALIVTGTEPRSSELTAEPYWDELAYLLRWAQEAVPSTLLSCLASHAAALALDGIVRTRLPAKQSGVFRQAVERTDPLTRGLGGTVAFPHSRLNEIPGSELVACGYRLVVASAESGWTIAARETRDRILVLLQGHPEYSVTTLLREYRRDVRRHLEGTAATHPSLPVNYLDSAGVALLEAFRVTCEGGGTGAGCEFPYQAAARCISADWTPASWQFFANWMSDALRRNSVTATL